jgi:hypothetical protein
MASPIKQNERHGPKLGLVMAALLQPPPLLTVAVALLLTAAAMWLGLRRRPASTARVSEDASGRSVHGVASEEDEVWGAPDPAPPARRPFSYERLVAGRPEVNSVEPRHADVSAQPKVTEAVPPAPAASQEAFAPALPPAASPSPVAAQPKQPPDVAEQPAERRSGQNEEISLADIFTRGQRRREQEEQE